MASGRLIITQGIYSVCIGLISLTRLTLDGLDHLQCIVSERFRYTRPPDGFKRNSLADAVRRYMRDVPRSIPPMFFYDRAGSQLFEKICALPEYYQTRTETAILRTIRYELSRYLHGRFRLVELGSGSSTKTRCILDSLQDMGAAMEYVPIDISDSLEDGAGSLLEHYPTLNITGIVDTYERGLSLMRQMDGPRNLIIFLGSSLGNMTIQESASFLETVRASMKKGDLFLLGLDMDKDAATLEAAYNDAQGITAEFNLNVLHRLNRELHADFDVSKFSHHSVYNKGAKRIEMYVKSEATQTVNIPGADTIIRVQKGELIHTENSQKYTIPHIRAMAADADLQVQRIWRDADKKFSVTLLGV